MHCVLCEKLIMSDTGDDKEMSRLLRTGELELRKVMCSFGRPFQFYPVCGDCIRKEKAELEEGVLK